MATFEELKQAVTDAIAEVDLAEDDILAAEDAISESIMALATARGKLDTATSRHMEALKKLMNANANLNNWVPPEPDPEPPAPSPVTGFYVGRMLHEQDTRFSVPEQARLWEFQVIQGDIWKLPMVQQLRQADPKATLLRYAAWTARRGNDPNGYSTLLPPSAIPDHWLLRNGNGQILYRNRDGDQFVDPGNPSYREAAANRMVQLFRDQPYWTGVWIDEIIGDWNWFGAVNMSGIGPRTSGGVLYTRETWQTAVLGLVSYVAQRLQSGVGVEVWANLSATAAFQSTDPWSKAIVSATSGTTQEHFIARGNEPLATLENGVYRATSEWLNYLNGTGKKYHMHAQTDSPQLADYAAGAFAMMAEPARGFFSAGKDPYPVRDQLDTPLMQVLRRTGAPKGTAVGGIRPFTNGTMRINASSQASSTLPALSARWEPA